MRSECRTDDKEVCREKVQLAACQLHDDARGRRSLEWRNYVVEPDKDAPPPNLG